MSVFDKFALRYDLWYEKPFGRSVFEVEVECLRSFIPKGKVLEVGVGTGRFAHALGVNFGLDPSFEMLKIAKKRGIHAVVGIGESLPFKSEVFDACLLVVTLCFVKDPLEVLRECGRVLKEGGRLILGLVLSESPWADFYRRKAEAGHPIYKLARFYSYDEVGGFLKRGGFRIDKVRSALLGDPQDESEVEGKVVDGFIKEAGFTCVCAVKTS